MPRGTRHLRALSSSLLVFAGHAIFKLTYLSNHDYKHLYFESDAATVNEIVLKVSVRWQRVPGGVFQPLLGERGLWGRRELRALPRCCLSSRAGTAASVLRSRVCLALVNGDTSSLWDFIGTHQLSLCPSRLFRTRVFVPSQKVVFPPSTPSDLFAFPVAQYTR